MNFIFLQGKTCVSARVASRLQNIFCLNSAFLRSTSQKLYLRLYIYAYWADAYYAYILVRIYLSCTVGEVSGVEIKRREEDEEKIEGSKKYCFVCRKKSI